MSGAGLISSKIIGQKVNAIKDQRYFLKYIFIVFYNMIPYEEVVEGGAVQAIEGEAVEAALDLGLVATGVELLPMAAAGLFGYGLYELGKKIT